MICLKVKSCLTDEIDKEVISISSDRLDMVFWMMKFKGAD